jgi:hypothetical protein
MERQAGRYNLQRLGWKAFEDLVIEINRTILGASVTPFRMGADGGRDGFFNGEMAGEFKSIAKDAATVVIQCKHTSSVGDGLKLSDVSSEIPKITKLAKDGEADLFAIFTNRRLGADDDLIIRTEFEKIDGVKYCHIFAEEWIELHIDGNYKLLRRVPRLFGIGDLSQILSNNVSKQTRLILEEMKSEQAVFVPTPSYREAVSAIEHHGLVVLVGPPASGKSAIAVNLCMVLGAEDEDLEVLKIETAEQFTSTWSAEDTKKLFWVEDFFGETTLDVFRTKPWAAAFEKVVTARKAGNKFIFTCRDYILRDAHSQIRKNKLDLFDSRTIFVRVDDLKDAEKERILYNHIKMGSLPVEKKRSLKEFLPMIASLNSFTPEIARRFGDERFHGNLKYERHSLIDFVEKPIHFFTEVIHDLGNTEQAVIAYLLLSNNSLTDPVQFVPPAVSIAYGVKVDDVRRALERLKGSLTKLSVVGKNRVWQVHHPSMIDAMHRTLKEHGAMLDLFIEAAPVEVVIRDCSTIESEHKLFVPETLYKNLFCRLQTVGPSIAAAFIENQCEEFLRFILSAYPDELSHLMGNAFDKEGRHYGMRLLVQIRDVLEVEFDAGTKAIEQSLEDALWSNACVESVFSEEYEIPIDDTIIRKCLRLYSTRFEGTIDSFLNFADNHSKNYSEIDDVLSHLCGFYYALEDVVKNILSHKENQDFRNSTHYIFDRAKEDLEEKIRRLDFYREEQADEWRHEQHERTEEGDTGMFSDVDL